MDRGINKEIKIERKLKLKIFQEERWIEGFTDPERNSEKVMLVYCSVVQQAWF